MKSESGYQAKTKAELSNMERDELLMRLVELRGVLNYQSSIVNEVVLQFNAAEKAYNEANEAMIAANKEMDDLVEKHRGGKGVDLYVQMEVARLKGIENFAADTLQRAKQNLDEKREVFDTMVDEGIAMSNELDFINKIADETTIKQEGAKAAQSFNSAAVYQHTTRNN